MGDKWVPLGSLAEFVSGGTPSKSESNYWGGDVPWVSAKDMKTRRINDTEDHLTELGVSNGTRLVPAGTSLILVRGMTLLSDVPICIAKRDVALNQDVKALIPNERVLGEYLNYSLLAAKPTLRSTVDLAGHGTGKIPTSLLTSLKIRLPDLGEQHKIVRILGSLDDKIELNRRMNETLEEMARALFTSWFVDFDPVRAKAAGEPEESICRRLGLTPALLALFPARFQPSELGEIPEGWESANLEKYADLNPETWSKETAPDKISYVDLANVKWGDVNSVQILDWDEAPSRAQRVLRPGDVILGTVRPGNGSYALINNEGLTGSTGFAVLRPQRAEYRDLVYLCATSPDNIARLSHLADGGAYPAVRSEAVIAAKCVISTDAIIRHFATIVGPIMDEIAAGQKENLVLAEIRDTLLPKLISGELRVPMDDVQ